MNYITVKQAAQKWNLSERSVRGYCQEGKLKGTVRVGNTWGIPEDAVKPARKKRVQTKKRTLLEALKQERANGVSGGIYHKIQIELTYNSNHIEGSKLTHDQTRFIYETNTIGITDDSVNVDDVIETVNHFTCIDKIIDCANLQISEKLIKELHYILKSSTADSRREWFAVGDYKRLPNEVADRETTQPENVHSEMKALLEAYNKTENKTLVVTRFDKFK